MDVTTPQRHLSGPARVGRPRAGLHHLRSVVTRSLVAVGVLLCLGMTGASAALANSATISVTNTAGASDPAAEIPRVFTLSGVSSTPAQVFVKYRAPGGAECAPSASEDSGRELESSDPFDSFWWGEVVNGDFSLAQAYTWPTTGATLFCIWIAPNSESIATPISQQITFRGPTGTVGASINPSSPTPGQLITVTVSGASEAAADVYATVKTGGGGASCAPTPQSDSGTSLLSSEVNGTFSHQETLKEETAGTYQLCTWLMPLDDSSPPALAGPQTLNFTVAYPQVHVEYKPPPAPKCVVPTFTTRMSASTVKRRIEDTHCKVGAIVYAHSRTVRRGDVVRLSPKPHTHLANGAHIRILVSLGRS